MRIIKNSKVRRTEILDIAEVLFEQKGFDGTSTNEILKKAGIARGTLYYHFKSKEAIMDALIERQSASMLSTANEIATDKHLSIVDRIIKVILSLNLKQDNAQMLQHLHTPQNALMHQKVQAVMLSGTTPILANLIREGIDQGLFHTPYPYECMEMVLTYADTIFDHNNMFSLTQEERLSRIEAFLYNLERLLGVKDGSLSSQIAQIFVEEGVE